MSDDKIFNLTNGQNDENNSDGFTDRLKTIIGDKSIRAFALESGVSETAMRQYVSGKSDPSRKALIAIARSGKVGVEWLASGKGPKLTVDYIEDNYIQKADGFIYVSNISIQKEGSSGEDATSKIVNTRYAFRSDWIEKEGLQAKRLAMFNAKGDSMEPLIKEGEKLLVETFFYKDPSGRIHQGLEPGTFIESDGVYVIRLDRHMVVKRLQLDMQGGVYIKNDNQTYETIHLTKEKLSSIVIVAKVILALPRRF